MSGRRILLIAVLWVCTVAGASALTWSVIASAGDGVGQPSRVTVTSTGSRNVEPVPGSGTWTGTGGRLTASCEGNAISLGGAVPADGYWAKPYERGPDRLRVDFESKDDDDRTEVRVYAVCVDGRPEFRHE